MDLDGLRWQRYLGNAAVVFLAIGAYQFWQGRFNLPFVVALTVLYLVIALATDVARDRWTDE